MEAARAAVHKITSRKGHTTDVDEYVNPAVTSETVKPHRHEETQEAVDREVHQDHYHTTVQPIAHKEHLPEKHTHNVIPQVHREFKHDNEAETKERVARELGQFQHSSTTHQTTHSTNAAPAVTGEHVHHHVHETVQPIVHKETVQPEVVHTTVPIHETHHAGAQHHGLSALPMKTLDEFKHAGGVLSGNKSHTHEEYDGAPRPYNEKLSTTIEKVLPGHHGSHTGTHTGTGSGLTGSNTTGDHTGSGLTGSHTGQHSGMGSGLTGSNNGMTGSHTGHHSGTGSGLTGNQTGSGLTDSNNGLTGSHTGHHNGSSNLGTTDRRADSGIGSNDYNKPSMGDKLNPRVDADRDGKAGFMD